MKHGKKYIDSAKNIESAKLYDADEAVSLVLDSAKAKFDETIELHVRLGVDPKQADQQLTSSPQLTEGPLAGTPHTNRRGPAGRTFHPTQPQKGN